MKDVCGEPKLPNKGLCLRYIYIYDIFLSGIANEGGGVFNTYHEPLSPNVGGVFNIYVEPLSPIERGTFKIQDDPELPNKGACFRYMVNRNHQIWGVLQR